MFSLHPADEAILGMPGYLLAWLILLTGLIFFAVIIHQRYRLLGLGQADPRFSDIGQRLKGLISFGLIQKRQPRYLWAGLIHFFIFWGFVVLGLRSLELIFQGLGYTPLGLFKPGGFGVFYNSLKDVFELLVLIACLSAILRRAVGRPDRYKLEKGYGHPWEAYFVLFLISFLMITDMLFEGSALRLGRVESGFLPATRLAAWFLAGLNPSALKAVYLGSFWFHLLTLFFFLNLLPRSKHFHILTALPNIFFRKLNRGAVKPARWGIKDLEELDSLGIGRFEDFTWKHVLDFFTCTECGRCSDNCPAKAVGRPLSPKMLTIKLRDYGYKWKSNSPPVPPSSVGGEQAAEPPLIGGVVRPEEIWSCTTCGACEEECPVFIEYIDKTIDFRRHLIETAQNPKTFNQVLMQVEKTGNPFGKPPKKRADWVKELEGIPVKVLKDGEKTDVLYFVDSYGSYDLRIQGLAKAIARGLHQARVSFGILGPRERDSGHQIRRIGEEGLFQFLVAENTEALGSCTFKQIVTTDPHAFNTLKKDYPGRLPVVHYSQFFSSLIEGGRLKPRRPLDGREVYTYHDPCYLGRHNGLYEEPRKILRSLPGIRLVEMERCRDRSFCCGGGDVNLWHEIEGETIRMAARRTEMAREAGAQVIVTACPFCLLNFEDAIKTAGLEGELRVVDLMELLISTI